MDKTTEALNELDNLKEDMKPVIAGPDEINNKLDQGSFAVITLNKKPIAKAYNLAFEDSGDFKVIIIKGKIKPSNTTPPYSDFQNKEGFNIINTNHVFSRVVFEKVQSDWRFKAKGFI